MDETTVTFGMQIWQQVMPWVAMAVASLLILGLKHLVSWAKTKSQSARFRCAMDMVEALVPHAVREAQQTLVQELKKDGKLSRDDAERIFRNVLKSTKDSMGPKWLAQLKACLKQTDSGMDAFLRTQIESEVHSLKGSP
jgi:polyhydroxyalkanoate synthesis regulator phasin